ncbi:MAG: preprotein translocase subunit SecY [Thermoflexales bacterium]|nr:preprotein translocase subunit SecY [Thermoflexales bacterium]
MIQAVRSAFALPDLRKKILFTLLILVIYRVASHIPVPGVDQAALDSLFNTTSGVGALANVINLLSGGAVSNFSVLAMGVYPYITAQIILQLLVGVIPALERMMKEEGSAGRKKIETYTYILTVPMAMLSGIGQVRLFSTQGEIIKNFGFGAEQILPTMSVILTMTAGTFFAIWLGEMITEQGIGQGLSIIIFGGIVARLPQNIAQLLADPTKALGSMIAFVIIITLIVLVIVVVQEGQRRIPVQYGKRVRGRKVYGGGSTHIPLKVNMAGMIPLIFAQSILTLPAIISQIFAGSTDPGVANFFTQVVNIFSGGRHSLSFIYWILYFALVVGFTYFYTDVMVQQQNLPDTLQKQGGFIPGIRPGPRTEEYLNGVTRRITLVGALFLGGISVMPYLISITGLIDNAVNFSILSTGLLIVVGVVLDTMRQLEAQLTMRHYEGFIK